MNMYTLLMAVVLVLAPLMCGSKRGNQQYIWLSCVLMFVVMGLRDMSSIGIDSSSIYGRLFREYGVLPWSEMPSFQNGDSWAYFWFMRLLYNITGGSYQAAYAIFAAIELAIFAQFLCKYSPSPVQSIVYFWGLMLFINIFDTMRQGLAMSILLLAFDAVMEKKPIRFLLLTLLAAQFHSPALIFIAAYPISKMKTNQGYLIFLAAMLILTYLFRSQILELMLSFYDTTIYEYDMNFLGNKVLIMIVIVVAAMVLHPPTKDDRVYNILLQFMGIAIVIQTFASYNNTFERLANYYFQFAVVFIPMVFQLDRPRSRVLDSKSEYLVKQIAPWLFGAFGVWRFASYIQSNAWIWLPYRFFFQA